ncbi:MAG: class I SAM-dependent methyltransferase [Solirubrobacteraceae bacterium]
MRSLDDAIWQAAAPDGEPEHFARRRDWLLARVVGGERVADVGSGLGHFAAALAGAGCEVVALDSSPVAVRLARERHPDLDVRQVEADGKLSLEDSSIDVVWAGEVIEHVADTAAWLSELRRVLRSGGRLLLSTPYHGRVKTAALALARHEEHFDPRGPHLRFYTRRALRELLLDLGFEDVVLSTLGGPPLLRATLLAQAHRAGFAVA